MGQSLQAELGRKPPVHLIVRRDQPVDPGAGVDQDESLLKHAASTTLQLGNQVQEAQAGDAIHLRFWTNRPCIVVGRGYARRLPRPVERVGELPVLVRSSGGEVVIHGPGVLNMALAVPAHLWTGSIDEAFAAFAQGVVDGLHHLGLQAEVQEIADAYCPGRYDVAISGRKIMGTSQRRTREATLIHGSLNVAVSPEWLGGHIAAFYEAAQVDSRVDITRIASLHEWGTDVESGGVEDALIAGTQGAWSARLQRQVMLPHGTGESQA